MAVLCGQTFENNDAKTVTCYRLQSKSEDLFKMVDGSVMLTHAQSQVPVVFIVFERFSVRIGENDAKKLVWMKIFCFAFENALVAISVDRAFQVR